MTVQEELNKILKEMWRLDEKMISGEALSDEEQQFFDSHLHIIKKYYEENNHYWQKKNKQ